MKAASKQPLAQVKEQIRQNLLQSKKTSAFQKWLDGVKKNFAKKVSYQAGYVPAGTSTDTVTTAPTTG